MQNFAPLTLPEMLKLSCHGQTIYARKRIFERFRNFESVRRLTKACRLTSAIPLKAAARWSDKNHSKPFSSSPKDATEKPSRATQSNKIREAVIVEGLSDKRAVQRSVPHAIFVLGSSTWVEGKNSVAVLTDLKRGLGDFDKVIVLLDPDFSGRKGRNILEASFAGQFWHAFIPVALATSKTETRWHEAGNVGVEHASPEAIRAALVNSRQADPGRSYFSRDKLMEMGLTASHTDVSVFINKVLHSLSLSHLRQAGRIRDRREMVCNYLGIGSCDGKQLLKQLNIFNFTEAEVMHALNQLKEEQNLRTDEVNHQAF